MIYTILFLVLSYLILTHSEISLYYAFNGFTLWYSKMIPALLPFMILSGILIRMNLTESFSKIFHPILGKIYCCSKNVSYAILFGFLCGFPMGAKATADLLKSDKITCKEAEFLLAFCNNIGPVYFCSFVIPLLETRNTIPYLFGMYGIPLLYGILLRFTIYKKPLNQSVPKALIQSEEALKANQEEYIFFALDASIKNSIQNILMLCGYMVFFNLLNILPHFLFPSSLHYIAPLLEITGGLALLQDQNIYYSLCVLAFGGLSCIAQTFTMIADTQMSILKYLVHKLIITMLTVCYYLLCYSFHLA